MTVENYRYSGRITLIQDDDFLIDRLGQPDGLVGLYHKPGYLYLNSHVFDSRDHREAVRMFPILQESSLYSLLRSTIYNHVKTRL